MNITIKKGRRYKVESCDWHHNSPENPALEQQSTERKKKNQ